MNVVNHQFRLASRPVGMPKRSNWSYTEEPVRELADDEVLVKVLYISLDPAMRGWMNEGKVYIAPVGIGEVMRAGGIGRVIASKNPGFAVGDHVTGALGRAGIRDHQRRRPDEDRPGAAPLPVWLERAGHAGHDGLFRPARRRPAQGRRDGRASPARPAPSAQIVGQIAKIKGCRVDRHRRRRGQVPITSSRSSASTPPSTTRRRT